MKTFKHREKLRDTDGEHPRTHCPDSTVKSPHMSFQAVSAWTQLLSTHTKVSCTRGAPARRPGTARAPLTRLQAVAPAQVSSGLPLSMRPWTPFRSGRYSVHCRLSSPHRPGVQAVGALSSWAVGCATPPQLWDCSLCPPPSPIGGWPCELTIPTGLCTGRLEEAMRGRREAGPGPRASVLRRCAPEQRAFRG